MSKCVLASILILILCTTATTVNASIDELFDGYSDSTPGCSIAASHNSEVIFSKSYGMANLEHNVPLTSLSVFNVASVSKQFTAAAVAMLILEGKLELDTRIVDHFPELGAMHSEVTIEHLVRHTSGIRDYIPLLIMRGQDWDDSRSNEELLSLIAAQRRLNFTPGAEWEYSNSGYILLAWLVEKVSGKRFGEYVAEKIFEPAGMKVSWFRTDYRVIPNRATDYEKEDGWVHVFSRETVAGDGALHTTPTELLKWHDYLYSTRGEPLRKLMHQVGKFNNGLDVNYAFGIGLGERSGLGTVSHGGSTGGYRSFLLRIPSERFSVAVACNRSDANPYRIAAGVSSALLNGFEIVHSEYPLRSVSEYVGSYEFFPGNHIKYETRESRLYKTDSVAPLLAIGEDKFLDTEDFEYIHFVRNADGEVIAVRRTDFGRPREHKKVGGEIEFDRSEYLGTYYSASLDARYTFSLDGGDLYCSVAFAEPRKVIARADDDLEAFGRRFRFVRGEDGKLSGFDLDGYRVRNISFVKE
ncbi:MAG: serine hydrolase domain-containing protein [Parvibaculaceae bacterium]